MLSKISNFVNTYKSDIYLTLAIILIALISFGAGRLTAPKNNIAPIIINQPASLTESASNQNQSLDNNNSVSDSQIQDNRGIKQGLFVGSIKSNKYHLPTCAAAKKISPQNQIWFQSEEEAMQKGYIRAKNCFK